MSNPNLVQRRPAESVTAGAGVLAIALGQALDLSADWQGVVIAAVALLPAVVTAVVELRRR